MTIEVTVQPQASRAAAKEGKAFSQSRQSDHDGKAVKEPGKPKFLCLTPEEQQGQANAASGSQAWQVRKATDAHSARGCYFLTAIVSAQGNCYLPLQEEGSERKAVTASFTPETGPHDDVEPTRYISLTEPPK